MSRGIDCRHSSAAAPTGPLAWELPYAIDVALKSQNIYIYYLCNADFFIGLIEEEDQPFE